MKQWRFWRLACTFLAILCIFAVPVYASQDKDRTAASRAARAESSAAEESSQASESEASEEESQSSREEETTRIEEESTPTTNAARSEEAADEGEAESQSSSQQAATNPTQAATNPTQAVVVDPPAFVGEDLFAVETSSGPQEVEGTLREDLAVQLWDLIGTFREEQGLSPLEDDRYLGSSALGRVAEVSLRFDGARPDGNSWYQDNSLALDIGGENLYRGSGQPSEIMSAWSSDPLCLRNLSSEAFTRAALVCLQVDGDYFWALLFSY